MGKYMLDRSAQQQGGVLVSVRRNISYKLSLRGGCGKQPPYSPGSSSRDRQRHVREQSFLHRQRFTVTVKITRVILKMNNGLLSLPGVRYFLLYLNFHSFTQYPNQTASCVTAGVSPPGNLSASLAPTLGLQAGGAQYTWVQLVFDSRFCCSFVIRQPQGWGEGGCA